MAPISTELVDTPIGKIQVLRGGVGPQLVYFHSAAGEGIENPLLTELSTTFEVAAPIFPGFGDSEGIEQIDDMEDAVFHLLDLWEVLGLDAPIVAGVSLGGWMGAELATRYPERVGRLVLVNPVGLYIESAPVKELFGRPPNELAEDLFADQTHPIAQMMHAMGAFTGDVGKQMEIPLEPLLPMIKAFAATARVGWDPYLHNPKLRARLRRITAPTLVIRGAADTLVPEPHAQAYASEIPGARLEIIAGAAHAIMLERPAEVARAITAFAEVR